MTRQQAAALRKANDIRSKRAKFKGELGQLARTEGCAILAEILERGDLEDRERPLATMRISEFLEAPHRMGRANVDSLYREADIIRRSPRLTVGQLTEPERLRIAAILRGKAAA